MYCSGIIKDNGVGYLKKDMLCGLYDSRFVHNTGDSVLNIMVGSRFVNKTGEFLSEKLKECLDCVIVLAMYYIL